MNKKGCIKKEATLKTKKLFEKNYLESPNLSKS